MAKRLEEVGFTTEILSRSTKGNGAMTISKVKA